jgi:hypothetical protein
MKVFISWSGNQSKELGEAFRDWIPNVIQAVTPYFTPSDLEKGTRWANDIAQELENSSIGLLCITRENTRAPWLMFEAGALSKCLEKAQVCPILFGVVPADVEGPLKQFQFTAFQKSEVKQLIATINGKLQEGKLAQKTLDTVFEKWWPDLYDQVSIILAKEDAPSEPIREDRELLEEILLLTRSTNASLHQIPNIDNLSDPPTPPSSSEMTGGYLPGSTGSFVDWTQLLHQFANIIRNKCLMMMPDTPIYSTPDLDDNNTALPNVILARNKEYFISLLETLADLFKLVAPASAKVWVSLRDRRADDNYHTFARAGVYNRNRENSSQPIHKNANVVLRLKENYKNNCCVLLTGSEHGPQVWERSENDKYEECKSVLLGAILTRAWNSDNDCWANNKLVWILGINSDTKNAFTNAHPELMQTCVVALSFIANIIARQDGEGHWNSSV